MTENAGPLRLPVDEKQHLVAASDTTYCHSSGSSAAHTVAGEPAFGDKHSGYVILKHRQDIGFSAFFYHIRADNPHVERKQGHRSLGGTLNYNEFVEYPGCIGNYFSEAAAPDATRAEIITETCFIILVSLPY